MLGTYQNEIRLACSRESCLIDAQSLTHVLAVQTARFRIREKIFHLNFGASEDHPRTGWGATVFAPELVEAASQSTHPYFKCRRSLTVSRTKG